MAKSGDLTCRYAAIFLLVDAAASANGAEEARVMNLFH
jgi:hypothetical protein